TDRVNTLASPLAPRNEAAKFGRIALYRQAELIPEITALVVPSPPISSSSPMLDILVIAPHPDDAELGMGGAILKFRQEGRRIGVLDLTSGEPTPHGTPEPRVKETAAATK